MGYVMLLRDYMVWHYSVAIVDIFHLLLNYVWAIGNMFSVKDVLFTLLSPWKRMEESKGNILKDPEQFFSNLFVNIMMRIVGFFVRTALLFVALLSFVFVCGGGLVFLLVWLFIPLILVALLSSVYSVFSA